MFTEPAIREKFYGREDVLKTLSKRVEALKSGYRQNVALTGNIFAGKSSILHHFLDSIHNDKMIPIYIEVIEEPFSSFANKFIATLLYGYLMSNGISCEKKLNTLIEKSEKLIPQTVEHINAIKTNLKSRSLNKAYALLLDLTFVFKKETGMSCIVVLDEFHNMQHFKVKKPFFNLGKIIMIQKGTMYIVSSSQKNKIRKILSEKLSLLFGNFEIIEVTGFNPGTSKNFIRDRLKPIEISEYYVDYIMNLTERNPFYLNIISEAFKGKASRDKSSRVNVNLLVETLKDVLYDSSGTLNQHFTNNVHFLIDKKFRKKSLLVLRAMSSGASRLKDIQTFTKKPMRKLSSKLQFLQESDFIFKQGSLFKIQDKLFEFWLKNVFFPKESALINKPDEKLAEFITLIDNDIETFLIDYKKDVQERIYDLFSCFKGDKVEIDKRVRMLPRFEKIEPLKYIDEKKYLYCKNDNNYWLCQIKKDRTDENDIIGFIQRSQDKKLKIARKLLISLSGIESNALLLAKEKGIWVWDSGIVNSLLRLYEKHTLLV